MIQSVMVGSSMLTAKLITFLCSVIVCLSFLLFSGLFVCVCLYVSVYVCAYSRCNDHNMVGGLETSPMMTSLMVSSTTLTIMSTYTGLSVSKIAGEW